MKRKTLGQDINTELLKNNYKTPGKRQETPREVGSDSKDLIGSPISIIIETGKFQINSLLRSIYIDLDYAIKESDVHKKNSICEQIKSKLLGPKLSEIGYINDDRVDYESKEELALKYENREELLKLYRMMVNEGSGQKFCDFPPGGAHEHFTPQKVTTIDNLEIPSLVEEGLNNPSWRQIDYRKPHSRQESENSNSLSTHFNFYIQNIEHCWLVFENKLIDQEKKIEHLASKIKMLRELLKKQNKKINPSAQKGSDLDIYNTMLAVFNQFKSNISMGKADIDEKNVLKLDLSINRTSQCSFETFLRQTKSQLIALLQQTNKVFELLLMKEGEGLMHEIQIPFKELKISDRIPLEGIIDSYGKIMAKTFETLKKRD